MTKYLILILTVLCLCFQDSNAQKQKLVLKGFAFLSNGDTSKAETTFKKALKKHIDIHAVYYGLGLIQKNSNPKNAFINFKKTEKKFLNSGKDFKKYMASTYNITLDSAREKYNSIAAIQLRRTIEKDSTEKGFGIFAKTYKGCAPIFIKRALTLKEEAAYRAARQDTTLKKAKKFTYDYPNSHKINFIMEYIDSVEYFSRLVNGTWKTLYKYTKDYERGKLFSLKTEDKARVNSIKKQYYSQATLLSDYMKDYKPNQVLTDEFMDLWKKEVYYSGHWTRLKFFYDRLPHKMDDSLKRMYYAGLYGEANYATSEVKSFYYGMRKEFYLKKDSIYDFYIRRAAPSLLALKKIQELYAKPMSEGKIDEVVKIIDKYAPLFPNYKNEIEDMKQLLVTNNDYCKKTKLPEVINAPSLRKPVIKSFEANGQKVQYLDNGFRYNDAVNRYPVISPDGKKLYLTHFEYKPFKTHFCIQTIHPKSQERHRYDETGIDTVLTGAGICYSELKNGRWQPLTYIDTLYLRDSILIRVDTTFEQYRFDSLPKTIQNYFVHKKIKNLNYKDKMDCIILFEKYYLKDSANIYTSGISLDNTIMYVIKNEKMQYMTNPPPKRQTYYTAKVVDITYNTTGQWVKPRVCGHLNHYYEEVEEMNPHPFFGSFNCKPSPDNSALLFAANRKGVMYEEEGFEVPRLDYFRSIDYYTDTYRPSCVYQPPYYTDIWISQKDEHGTFDYPTRLSDIINTEYGEYSPVLAADNKTLYFISNGRLGIGGTDIYMCKRLKENSWKEWSNPINLGKYINTPYNEFDFSITADGKTAYFTSEDPITHKQIFYSVELPKIFRPDTIAIYKGKITNLKGEPIFARIRVEDVDHKKIYADFRTQMPSGEFYFGLPQDRKYKFSIISKNCIIAFDTLNCDSAFPIVKTHDFVLADSVSIFDEHLPFEITKENKTAAIRFISKQKISGVEITIFATDANTAKSQATEIKQKFVSEGIEEEKISIFTKIGKEKILLKVL